MTILTTLKNRIDFGLLAALIIPLLAIVPLLIHAGLPNTADGPVHLMRQVELNQAWAEGNFYPRWGTDLAYGHGMPIFSYAPPFLYHLTQLFHLTGLPLDESMKATIIFDFLLYSAGMFLFIRRIFGTRPALLAAAVYVYAPYRLREAYIQGNYGQFSGLAFYPLIFWAFHGLITNGHPRYIIFAALSLAGLLFSHNISFMLFAPIFAVYLLFLLALHFSSRRGQAKREAEAEVKREMNAKVEEKTQNEIQNTQSKSPISNLQPPVSSLQSPISQSPNPQSPTWRIILQTIIAGLLGLGLAAIFWLPAFGERHDIKLEGITQGFFDFRENFITLPELLSSPKPLDVTAINPEFPLGLGLAQLIGAGLGLVALVVLGWGYGQARWGQAKAKAEAKKEGHLMQQSRIEKFASNDLIGNTHLLTHTLFFSLALLVYAFLALPYSQIVWEVVPLLELTEFPWRMLGPMIFCAAVLAAAGWVIIDRWFNQTRGQLLALNLAVGVVIALNGYYLFPSQFIPWGTPTPADAFAYEVVSGAIGTTSTGEFLPRWAQQHPQPQTLQPDYEAGHPPQKIDPASVPPNTTIDIVSHLAEQDSWHIDTPETFVATIRTLYWPGWQLYLNNQPLPFSITDNTGLIQTTIPAGQHTLTLQLETTPLRTIGLWLTIFAALGLVGVFVVIVTERLRLRSKHQISNLYPPTPNPPIPQSPISNLQPPVSNLQSPTSNLSLFLYQLLFVITLILISRPLTPLFTLQSDPDFPQPADRQLHVDFSDQIRLVGVDHLPTLVQLPSEGEADLTAVLYWRAQQDIDTNYTVFLHLDAPNGQTFATVDEVSPEDIPTRNWPPGLYLRNPLHLKIPANLPPIRYTLTTGVYQRDTGERLPILPGGETASALGTLWLEPPKLALAPSQPVATFGEHLKLHQVIVDENRVNLTWQTDQPLVENYSIFIHALDRAGEVVTQADGVPFDGLYPLPNWRPGQLIQDQRTVALDDSVQQLAVGVYNPTTGHRLPANDSTGQPLSDNRYLITVTR